MALKRITRVLGVLAVATASALPGLGSRATGATDPVALSGIVEISNGSPAARVRVTIAMVLPAEGVREGTQQLLETVTDSAGRWSLASSQVTSVLRAAAPSDPELRRRASIEIVAFTAQGPVVYDIPMVNVLATAGIAPKVEATTNSPALVARDSGTGMELRFGAGRVMPGDAAAYSQNVRRKEVVDAAADPSATAAGSPAPGCRSNEGLYWSPTSQTTTREIHSQILSTRGRSKAEYTWETTRSSRLGIAITWSGGAQAAGMEGSIEQNDAAGLEMKVGTNSTYGLLLNWNYRRFQGYCIPNGPPNIGGRLISIYKWRPEAWNLGNRNVPMDIGFTCRAQDTVQIGNRTWVARSSTATWSGWFSIGTAKLDASQTGSDRHQVVYDPLPGKTVGICGKGAQPRDAAFTREQ